MGREGHSKEYHLSKDLKVVKEGVVQAEETAHVLSVFCMPPRPAGSQAGLVEGD